MTALDTLIGPAPANFLRTLYASRRTEARVEGNWNAPAHEESLRVVKWFATGFRSGFLEYDGPVVVGGVKSTVVLEGRIAGAQMRMEGVI